jgi:hypothetical protein
MIHEAQAASQPDPFAILKDDAKRRRLVHQHVTGFQTTVPWEERQALVDAITMEGLIDAMIAFKLRPNVERVERYPRVVWLIAARSLEEGPPTPASGQYRAQVLLGLAKAAHLTTQQVRSDVLAIRHNLIIAKSKWMQKEKKKTAPAVTVDAS